MGNGSVSGPAGVVDEDEENLEEMYSTSGGQPGGSQRIQTNDDNDGRIARGLAQGVENYKENKNYFHDQWRGFLKEDVS